MCIETVTNAVVAICFGADEIGELGNGPVLSSKAAKSLVHEALKSRGVAPWPEIEVDLFTSEDGLLLLARPARRELHCFHFGSFEDVLSAALLSPVSPPSSLLYIDGGYVLCVRCAAKGIPPALFEYGEYDRLGERLLAHLNEHAETIIAADAVNFLKERFS